MSAVADGADLRRLRPTAEVLQEGLDRLGLTLRGFALRVGIDVSLVSKVLRGERKIPKRLIVHWAIALRLDGAAYRDFILAAHLDRTDPAVREHINVLRERLADLEGRA